MRCKCVIYCFIRNGYIYEKCEYICFIKRVINSVLLYSSFFDDSVWSLVLTDQNASLSPVI